MYRLLMEAKISLPLHMEEQSVLRIISHNIWRYSDTFISRKVLFREMQIFFAEVK